MREFDLVILRIKARQGFSRNGLAMIEVNTIDRSNVPVDIFASGAVSCTRTSGDFDIVVLIILRSASETVHPAAWTKHLRGHACLILIVLFKNKLEDSLVLC